MTQSRREFLKRGVAFVAAGAAMPAVFVRAAYATDNNGSASASTRKDRTLVIVQMAGGNDGLNTVVPYADSQYYSLRKNISIAQTAVLPLNERIGLHPALTGFKSFWDKGQLAVVEGVGYANPNLSHFRSMEIWHTAAPDAAKTTGWLGNYLDATHSESNSLWRAVSVGRELPVSMLASGSFVPAVESVAAYALQTDRKYPKDQANKINAWAALYAQAAAEPGLGAFVGETGGSAYKSSLELAKVSAGYTPQATYPGSAIGNALKLVAQVATSSLGTGIAYVTTGGYDTHSGEVGEQQRLFTELNAGVSAFMADIAAHGKANDVVLMTWSEFGRRVQVNASNGTDHGTAGPMFVLGGPVTGGAFGEPPSLSSLDRDGNLKFTTDFRRVYATMLEDWLGADSKEVLGGAFDKLGFLGSAPPHFEGPYKLRAAEVAR